jgi:hypothetical protein
MHSAMREAETLLRKGLSLVSSVGDDVRRQENELDLLLPLGRAVLAVKGFGAPEAAEIFARAREFGELISPNRLLPIMFGQWIYHLTRGDMDPAEQLAVEIRARRHPERHCCAGSRVPGERNHLYVYR